MYYQLDFLKSVNFWKWKTEWLILKCGRVQELREKLSKKLMASSFLCI